MNTATALLHDEFRQCLWHIASDPQRNQMERDLASLSLSLYDADPEHPAVVTLVNQFTKRALS
jgi:hypothetical protein